MENEFEASGPSVASVGSGVLLWREALPFLDRLSESALTRIVVQGGVAIPPREFIRTAVGEVPRSERARLARAIAESAFEEVLDQPLGRLIPSMSLLAGRRIVSGDGSRRLVNLLQRHRLASWSVLAAYRPREVHALRNVGVTSLLELLALAIERSLEALLGARSADDAEEPDGFEGLDVSGFDEADEVEQQAARHSARPDAGGPLPVEESHRYDALIMDALRIIAAWAHAERGHSSLPEALRALLSGQDVPGDVAQAWQRLDEVDLSELGYHLLSVYNLADASRRLWDSLDERQAVIVRERVFALEHRMTLDSLAGLLGITRERVRQLESKAERRLRGLIDAPRNQVVRRAAARLRAQLGAAYPVHRLMAENPHFVPGVDVRTPEVGQFLLLLWAAGPYHVHGEWLILAPAERLIRRSRELLEQLTEAGPIPGAAALQALEPLEIAEPIRGEWLRSVGEGLVRPIRDLLVPWRGSLADKAALILQIEGQPMTREEISRAIGEPHSMQTLSNYLGDDGRFQRVDLRRFALTEWGLPRYTTIVDEITRTVEARGGEADIEEIAREIHERFGVAPSSVRSFASDPRFERTGAGSIRLRASSAPSPRRTIAMTRSCFRLEAGWAYRIVVNAETLRGSGMPIPSGVAAHIGLRPGGAIVLRSPMGDVRCTWPSTQPLMGSLSRVVDWLDARTGDYLFLIFAEPDRLEPRLVRKDVISRLDLPARLATAVGVPLERRGGDVVAALSFALGLETRSFEEVYARLSSRGDDELMAMLVDAAVDRG